jgi:hypothetical protein
VRFGPDGVEHHQSFGRGPITRLGWEEVHAVAVLPGPVEGRRALCVYPFRELPEPTLSFSERFSGTGPGLAGAFRFFFGTPLAVHLHHVRGPSLKKLDYRLSVWTDDRIVLTSIRPT